MNPSPASLAPKDLLKFSGEHLYYEIEMLYGVSRLIKEDKEGGIVYNALLESFVLHTSVILNFFYKMPLNPQEAKAVHYIKDLNAWRDILPPYNKYFIRFNKKRNREVAHLSYERLKVEYVEKVWDFTRLNEQLRLIIDLFLEHADPELLHPKLLQFKGNRF